MDRQPGRNGASALEPAMPKQHGSFLGGVMAGMLPLLAVGIYLVVYVPLDVFDRTGDSPLRDWVLCFAAASLPVGLVISAVRYRAATKAGNRDHRWGILLGLGIALAVYGLIYLVLDWWVLHDGLAPAVGTLPAPHAVREKAQAERSCGMTLVGAWKWNAVSTGRGGLDGSRG